MSNNIEVPKPSNDIVVAASFINIEITHRSFCWIITVNKDKHSDIYLYNPINNTYKVPIQRRYSKIGMDFVEWLKTL